MKKITVLDRIMYALNPKKSVKDFLEEADNVVNEYIITNFEKVGGFYSQIYFTKRKKHINYRRASMVVNLLLVASSVLLAFLIYQLLV